MEVEEDKSLSSRAMAFMATKQFIIGVVVVVTLVIIGMLYYHRESFSPKDEFDKLVDRIHKRQGIGKK
jgi:cell division protein FtsL